jgi:hypothetical protein
MLLRASDSRYYDDRGGRTGIESRDRYLTDGERLFRVVEPFAISEADAHVFMLLEDCMTLEVQSYSPQQLYGMHLRLLAAAHP